MTSEGAMERKLIKLVLKLAKRYHGDAGCDWEGKGCVACEAEALVKAIAEGKTR